MRHRSEAACLDSTGPSTVGMNQNGIVHETVRDSLSKFSANPGGMDLRHHTVPDMVDQRNVNIGKGTCRKCKILDSHMGNHIHHHIDDPVSVTKVMVEGYGHPVLQTAFYDDLFQCIDQFVESRQRPVPLVDTHMGCMRVGSFKLSALELFQDIFGMV